MWPRSIIKVGGILSVILSRRPPTNPNTSHLPQYTCKFFLWALAVSLFKLYLDNYWRLGRYPNRDRPSLIEIMGSHKQLHTFWRVSSRFEYILKVGSSWVCAVYNQQLDLSHKMMRKARLNKRGKRVHNFSRMTWIKERNYILTHFLADKRNPNKQNELRATWLSPQLTLYQFARPIVNFRLSAFLLFLETATRSHFCYLHVLPTPSQYVLRYPSVQLEYIYRIERVLEQNLSGKKSWEHQYTKCDFLDFSNRDARKGNWIRLMKSNPACYLTSATMRLKMLRAKLECFLNLHFRWIKVSETLLLFMIDPYQWMSAWRTAPERSVLAISFTARSLRHMRRFSPCEKDLYLPMHEYRGGARSKSTW